MSPSCIEASRSRHRTRNDELSRSDSGFSVVTEPRRQELRHSFVFLLSGQGSRSPQLPGPSTASSFDRLRMPPLPWIWLDHPPRPVTVRQLQTLLLGAEDQAETRRQTPGFPESRSPAFALFRLAVAVGFEPTEACTSHAFEVCRYVSGGDHLQLVVRLRFAVTRNGRARTAANETTTETSEDHL